MNEIKSVHQGLRAIALIMLIRGTIALALGVFLIRESASPAAPFQLQKLLASRVKSPTMLWFISLLGQIDAAAIYSIGMFALMLAAIRYAYAIGLWYEKIWVEWVVVITSLVFIPIELFNLIKSFSVIILLLLILNVAICIYLIRMLMFKTLK